MLKGLTEKREEKMSGVESGENEVMIHERERERERRTLFWGLL